MSGMIGRAYLDPGDRISGRYDPPRPCTVITKWGPGGGPRNVLVEYSDDGSQAVIPFSRRLRRAAVDHAEAREARARKVARLWKSGLSVRETARRVGVHPQTRKVRWSARLACGHYVPAGSVKVHRGGRWVCLDCALAAIKSRQAAQ